MCSKAMDVYVASCVETGGIYHYKFTDGECRLVDVTGMDRPMYMVIEGSKMYVVLRAPFENRASGESCKHGANRESGVVVYDIAKDGRLTNPSKIMSTHGEVACHIAVRDGKIYCANYISGSVVMLPDKVVQHTGVGVHPIRQEGPHAHYVGVTPDGKYICATDLGLDTIFLYHPDLTLHSAVKVPEGHGVRHLAFSQDGKYLFAVNELESTVAAFSYHDGSLELLDVSSILPEDFTGESIAAAIRIKDGHIYTSNRGHDSIAVLDFQDDKLELMEHISCGGRAPRDFCLAGDYLLSANQDSDTVSVLDGANGYSLVCNLKVETPICVLGNIF